MGQRPPCGGGGDRRARPGLRAPAPHPIPNPSPNPSPNPNPNPNLGKDHAILYPPPRHIDVEPAEPEPLRVNADIHALVAQCMAADAERLQNPALSQNRVVYDCHEPLDLVRVRVRIRARAKGQP